MDRNLTHTTFPERGRARRPESKHLKRPSTILAAALLPVAAVFVVGIAGPAYSTGVRNTGSGHTVVTVTPDTGLGDSQTVQVSGSGWAPASQQLVGECSGVGFHECARSNFVVVTVDSNGNFGPTSLEIDRTMLACCDRNGAVVTHTCAPTNDCYVEVAQDGHGVQWRSHSIGFTG